MVSGLHNDHFIQCITFSQWCACPSLPSPMEGSSTLTQHWVMALWPPTPVTLATLSMEAAPPGLVGVMECGVGQLQCVCISGINSYLLCVHYNYFQDLVLIYHH